MHFIDVLMKIANSWPHTGFSFPLDKSPSYFPLYVMRWLLVTLFAEKCFDAVIKQFIITA